MSAVLDPSELSQVYFLIDALVTAPEHAEELGALTKQSKRSARVHEAVDVLVAAFKEMQRNGSLRPDWETAIAEVVKHKDREVGDALAWALANRQAHRPRRAAGR